jgi:hypothetical protein
MLADRAARDWLGAALGTIRPRDQNALESLGQLGKPEDGYHDLEPAGQLVRQSAASPEEAAIGSLAEALGGATKEIDTEAPLANNRAPLSDIGRFGADALHAASGLFSGDEFLVAKANDTMRDLIDMRGWQNRLGPRFAL